MAATHTPLKGGPSSGHTRAVTCSERGGGRSRVSAPVGGMASPAPRLSSRHGVSADRPEAGRQLWAVLPRARGPREEDQPHGLSWRNAAVTRVTQKSQAAPWTLSLSVAPHGGRWRAERAAPGRPRRRHRRDSGAHSPARGPRARGRSRGCAGRLGSVSPGPAHRGCSSGPLLAGGALVARPDPTRSLRNRGR